MATDTPSPRNPLIIANNTSDVSLTVQLHPLVLLTISDYITRHTLRSQTGPIVGAVIGQQIGRNYTLEFAYQVKTGVSSVKQKVPGGFSGSEENEDDDEEKDEIGLDEEWFTERLAEYKEVHKQPALDLVAIFVLGTSYGPTQPQISLVRRIQQITAIDGILLLVFHGDQVENLSGGKLPISIYEPVSEGDADGKGGKVRELTFEVDSSDAEMIGVDFVAKGAGNAGSVTQTGETQSTAGTTASATKDGKSRKGKGRAKEDDEAEGGLLTTEEEELVSALAGRANAIKMLNQRLNFIREYLASVESTSSKDANHVLLRSIQSMLTRLALIASPQTSDSARNELTASEMEKQDVHLTGLLSALTKSVVEAQNLAKKIHIVQKDKAARMREVSSLGRPEMVDSYNAAKQFAGDY